MCYMESESLQGEAQFEELLFGNASLPCQMRLKSASQKLNFLMAKDI